MINLGRSAELPGHVITHRCHHVAGWEFPDGDPPDRDLLLGLVARYSCPSCGGQAGTTIPRPCDVIFAELGARVHCHAPAERCMASPVRLN